IKPLSGEIKTPSIVIISFWFQFNSRRGLKAVAAAANLEILIILTSLPSIIKGEASSTNLLERGIPPKFPTKQFWLTKPAVE
ncbi:1218_t:CDS:1, partial [Funneliformis geosporum]